MSLLEPSLKDLESYCTFSVCGVTCGVPVTRVRGIVSDQPITPVPLAHWSVRGLINLRGQILSVIDIGGLMGLSPAESTESPGRFHVIAETGAELISLTVDEMGPVVTVQSDQMELPPSNLDSSAAQIIVAAARLPQNVLLLLDLNRVADLQAST